MTWNTLFQVVQTRNEDVLNKCHLLTVDSPVPHGKFGLKSAGIWHCYYSGLQSFKDSQACIKKYESCMSRTERFPTGPNFDTGSQSINNLPCQKSQYFPILK